ncbi:MAG: hypothetical protein AAF417_04760 [Pseudomonadota bacterium]
MIRRIVTFVGAVLATYIVAVVLASNSVVASVIAMGLPVSLGKRIEVIGHDIAGMAASYLPLIAIGFLLAFLVAGLLARMRPGLRIALYVLAGVVAVFCINVSLKMAFDITPIAASRTTIGLSMQAISGAVGGYLFARFANA